MTPHIRGLTLTQPWALCIQQLGKDIENRTWHPKQRGGHVGMYLAIHGGRPPHKPTGQSRTALELRRDLDWITAKIINKGHLPGTLKAAQLRGLTVRQSGAALLDPLACIQTGILAICRLSHVTHDHPSPWALTHQYNWVLSDITPIEPVESVGHQGLWTIDPAITQLLRQRWAHAHGGQITF